MARTGVEQRLDCKVASVMLDAAQQRKRSLPLNATTVVKLAHRRRNQTQTPIYIVEWEKHTGKDFGQYYGWTVH